MTPRLKTVTLYFSSGDVCLVFLCPQMYSALKHLSHVYGPFKNISPLIYGATSKEPFQAESRCPPHFYTQTEMSTVRRPGAEIWRDLNPGITSLVSVLLSSLKKQNKTHKS